MTDKCIVNKATKNYSFCTIFGMQGQFITDFNITASLLIGFDMIYFMINTFLEMQK